MNHVKDAMSPLAGGLGRVRFRNNFLKALRPDGESGRPNPTGCARTGPAAAPRVGLPPMPGRRRCQGQIGRAHV